MMITIHRGTKQIGGCITEIKTDNARIFIDMGEELPGADSGGGDFAVEGVTAGHADCDAVFITHYHGDHIGLYKDVLPDIPIYMGEVAQEIFFALATRLKDDSAGRIKAFRTFKALDKIVIRDISVTPLLVDHSAFDAYMFLIESGGKRVLHTGDFRLHGFRGKAVLPTLKKYVGQVDVLITEGTMLSRGGETLLAEGELKMLAKRMLPDNKYIFVLCSSTNIDRIAVFYHAMPTGRYFVCDDYQKNVLDIVTKHSKEKTSLYDFKKVVTYGSNLDDRLRECGFCMMVRSNEYFSRIMRKFPDAQYIYSMWDGYMKGNEAITRFIEGYDFKPFHTSGHASKGQILAVCEAVKPRVGIIPIHSEARHNMDNLGVDAPILYLEDNEAFTF